MRAIAALVAVDAARVPRTLLVDRAARVRAAAAGAASDNELRVLVADPDPDVRAAAVAVVVRRGSDPAVVTTAADDEASQVRRAAVAGITDERLLARLAADADPDVATAALEQYVARRTREPAVTTEMLERLAVASPKSLERVRIARAWLLAR